MENLEQYYENEATGDWIFSGMIKMPVFGREKQSPKCYIIVISICFSYSKCLLERDRAGSWWKHSYVWMRQAKRRRRVWERTQNDVLWGAGPPPTECDFEGPHGKLSAMVPEFIATALRAITVSGPSTVYHLVSTPYSSFFTVTRLRSFSPHRGSQ